MLNILAEFQKRKTDTAVEVKVAGGNVSQIGHWLDRKGFPPERFSWSMQCDGHLGTKMAQTFDSSFKKGNEIAVIVSVCLVNFASSCSDYTPIDQNEN